MSEKEIEPQVEGEFRILALGDSFTEGDGVPYDSTWVTKLGKRLTTKEKSVTTVNAGIGGSDPVYEYILLQEKFVEEPPDLVLMTVNSSDLLDLNLRGGFERFQADGTSKVVEVPKWEWIYGISYIFRHIMHDLFAYPKNFMHTFEEEGFSESLKIMLEAIDKTVELAEKNDFRFMVIIHPTDTDFESKGYLYAELDDLIENLTSRAIPVLDIKEYLKKRGYISNKDIESIYWPINRHFNQKGYNLFLDGVVEKLKELGWDGK